MFIMALGSKCICTYIHIWPKKEETIWISGHPGVNVQYSIAITRRRTPIPVLACGLSVALVE